MKSTSYRLFLHLILLNRHSIHYTAVIAERHFSRIFQVSKSSEKASSALSILALCKINNAEHLIAEFKYRSSAEFGRSALLTWPFFKPCFEYAQCTELLLVDKVMNESVNPVLCCSFRDSLYTATMKNNEHNTPGFALNMNTKC